MPRPKSRSDEEVLDTALLLVRQDGPESLTFQSLAQATGLSASTLVQRFRTKQDLVRAALMHAWDDLDRQTAYLAATLPNTPNGAVQLLIGLSHYGGIEAFAEGLLLLREDLRDPLLRRRGQGWKAALISALDEKFAETPDAPPGIGLMLASQWQGSLIWWGFDPQGAVEAFVEPCLRKLLEALRVA
jgi:AcrR family transcriptional regulator